MTLVAQRLKYKTSYSNIYRQDATLHSLFMSENFSKCFWWYHHPSSGAHTTVSTASGICHTLTVICLYRGRVGTGLSVLWVAYKYVLHVVEYQLLRIFIIP